MDFSIIIPAKNELGSFKKNLHQFDALRGVFTHELIIADGASTDGTIEFSRTVADRVEVKTKTGRETIGEGRNRGAAVARGEILMFFDAGVRIPDIRFFCTEVRRAFDDPRVVAVTVPVTIYPEHELLRDKIVHGIFNGMIRCMNIVGMGAAKGEAQIMRRSIFKKIGGFKQALAAGEDFDLYRRLAREGRVRYLSQLKAYDDPRRFRSYGYARVLFRSIRNDLWVRLFGRSWDSQWERVN